MLVEPRGLEPLTPALQRRLDVVAACRSMATTGVGVKDSALLCQRLSVVVVRLADFSLTPATSTAATRTPVTLNLWFSGEAAAYGPVRRSPTSTGSLRAVMVPWVAVLRCCTATRPRRSSNPRRGDADLTCRMLSSDSVRGRRAGVGRRCSMIRPDLDRRLRCLLAASPLPGVSITASPAVYGCPRPGCHGCCRPKRSAPQASKVKEAKMSDIGEDLGLADAARPLGPLPYQSEGH